MNISFPLLLRGEGVFFFIKRMLREEYKFIDNPMDSPYSSKVEYWDKEGFIWKLDYQIILLIENYYVLLSHPL